MLIGGVIVGGAVVLASPLRSIAAAAGQGRQAQDLAEFLHLSQLLINHRLVAGVGERIQAFLVKQHADGAEQVRALIAIAEKKQAKVVEDFFGDIPAGPAEDLAHWIIFAWYTGASSAKPDATVFAFEEALAFQTTIDVVTIPSYGISGPDRWSQVTIPLVPMPVF
ncbi:dehydrogenase [Xylophilus rhododendri]|uniref:Dehydrogenase n=2 Tax=Xylophilus rhododendri TaxID=2697032 RepID=A0A857JEU5_9BURK|nr:dehydrogenase [Xylophilus rhododendri]